VADFLPRPDMARSPGPVLHLWQDGREVARVPPDPPSARALVEALLREVRAEVRAAQARDRTAGDAP
jgi:hypothetical protein